MSRLANELNEPEHPLKMSKTLKIARYIMTAVLAIYWPSIALGTHLPQQQIFLDTPHDKLAHFGSFLGLSFLLAWCVLYRQPSVRRMVIVLGIVLLYGVVDEITQTLVPTRHAEMYDLLADCCGAIAGLAVYFVSLRALSFLLPPGVADWSVSSSPVIPERT